MNYDQLRIPHLYPFGFGDGDVRAVLLVDQYDAVEELRAHQGAALATLPHSYLKLTPQGVIQELCVLGMPLLEEGHRCDPLVRSALFQHRLLYGMVTNEKMPGEVSDGPVHPGAWLDGLPLHQRMLGEIPVQIVGIT